VVDADHPAALSDCFAQAGEERAGTTADVENGVARSQVQLAQSD
jgi:hypothetical protein